MSAETIKSDSRYLAGTIEEELNNEVPDFSHDAELILKFHGIYQQDDRDVRRERKLKKLPVDFSCMVRASVPGGVIDSHQWLALDQVAGLTNDKLRLTTRQGVQYHVVHKGDLRDLVSGINDSLLTTLGACGDVVRNVMACPLPHPERTRIVQPVVNDLVQRFRPQTEKYWEIWVDGEQAVTAQPQIEQKNSIDKVEPIYGAAYLPRKFKIAIAWPGDNCVDIYTHDVGIVPTLTEGTTGELTGFSILVGGGMGMSHNRPMDTYPLLAQPFGWVPISDLGNVVEAIVAVQRDHGNREDRSRARLKYLVEERGVSWLRSEVEQITEQPISPAVDIPEWEVHTHHGWHDIESASALGLPVPSGTVAGGLRTALRQLVSDGMVKSLRVTPRQDLLLVGVSGRSAVENVLRSHDVPLASDQSATKNMAIACPALPTCSKALGEAERVLPEVVTRIEKLLADTGNANLPLRINMTGCPNGCSRPYAAELGIVGRTKRNYDIYVGGSPAGDRLARCLRDNVPLKDVPDLLRPLLERFSHDNGYVSEQSEGANPSFGDWCLNQDWEALQSLLPAPQPKRRASAADPQPQTRELVDQR
jgi:sulfite reductase (ferredoxin)